MLQSRHEVVVGENLSVLTADTRNEVLNTLVDAVHAVVTARFPCPKSVMEASRRAACDDLGKPVLPSKVFPGGATSH